MDTIETEKATKVELEVEKNRIDLLTKIENGQTEGNTELLDIRIGEDGTEYTTAGNSVRGQYLKLNKNINNIINDDGLLYTKNLNNIETTEKNYYLTSYTGEKTYLVGRGITDYIKVGKGTIISWYGSYGTPIQGALYDENKTPLMNIYGVTNSSGVTTSGSYKHYTMYISQDANRDGKEFAYARFNIELDNMASMVVKGETYPTDYIPYRMEFKSDFIKNGVEKVIDDYRPLVEIKPNISCYGDSLTAGAGTTTPSARYPKVIESITGYKTNICAVGGEGVVEIATRQGGNTLFIEPFTIPSDANTPVEIQLKNFEGNNIVLGMQGWYNEWGLNPCKINGIEGTIKYSNGKNTFERTTSGDSTTLTRRERVITNAFLNNMNDITIIWAGTNGTKSLTDLDTTIENIDRMINVLNTKKYLVIGLHCFATNYVNDKATLLEINKKLSKKYGSHFVDIYDYLIKYGLSDCNITPTSQDNTDLSNGIVPTSLRYDNVHFNDKGYEVIGKLLSRLLKQLGWINY